LGMTSHTESPFRAQKAQQLMVKQTLTAIERAFELARSGHMTSVDDIRAQLKREGYEQDSVVGRALVSQLRGIIDSTRGRRQSSDR
jgi:hypothetical protein